MRTFPNIKLGMFKDPAEREQIKTLSDMTRQVSGGLSRSILPGQGPAANPVPSSGGSTAPSLVPIAQSGDLLYGLSDGTWNRLPIGAEDTFLYVNNAIPAWNSLTGFVDTARTWTTLQTFKDTTFKVVDDGDATKTLALSLGGASAGADLTLAWAGTADRTVTIPDATATLSGLSVNETWTGAKIFDCVNGVAPEMDIDPTAGTDIYTFQRIVDASTGFGVNLQVNSNITADSDVLFPTAAGTILVNNGVAATTFRLRSNSASIGAAFAHTADLTKMLRFILSGSTTGTNNSITISNTASRNYTFPDAAIIVAGSAAALTSGRVPFATTGGLLIDDADLTFATDTLTATKIVGTTSVKVGTAAGYISSDGSTGATGSFTTVDGKTVTVKDGIITSIV